MNVLNHVRPRQTQQLVVALDVFFDVFKAHAPILGFVELKALNHCAHGTINNGNAFCKNARELLAAGVGDRLHGVILRWQVKFMTLWVVAT